MVRAMRVVMKKKKEKKIARMDAANRAMCFAFRSPPPGEKPMKYILIRKLVRKDDGSRPGISAMQEAVASFRTVKKKRGRKKGHCNTSKAEDKKLYQTFHKLRPPGHGVDSRKVFKALPKKLQKKMCRRTIRRRLAKKGLGDFHLVG